MWALGVIFYKLNMSLQHPFKTDNHYQLAESIKTDEPAPLSSTISPFIREIIGKLLEKDPNSRPSAE